MRAEEKIALNFYRVDTISHIEINKVLCKSCATKICLQICPGSLYTLGREEEPSVEYAGCLECGSCYLTCPLGAINWRYPRGGFGVQYRFG